MSNPAISVAVVIDTPTVGSERHYGGATSAPVFAEVAQQVLEYLGVPHDQPLKTKKEMLATATPKDELEDGPSDNGADLDAMFADVNNLPADDPLRKSANVDGGEAGCGERACSGVPVAAKKTTVKSATVMDLLPAKVLAAFRVKTGLDAQDDSASETAAVETKALAAPREWRHGRGDGGRWEGGGCAGVRWRVAANGGGAGWDGGTAGAAGGGWAGA